MTMADVFEYPQAIRFQLVRDDDYDVTCMLCHGDDTDMCTSWSLGGVVTVVGFHATCVKNVRLHAKKPEDR